MRKMRALSRMVLETVPALAAVPPTVASELCNYASKRPLGLQAELNARILGLGFDGLPPDPREKFVNDLLKSCIPRATNGTQCTLSIDATVGKASKLGCDAQPTRAGIEICHSPSSVPGELFSSIAQRVDFSPTPSPGL